MTESATETRKSRRPTRKHWTLAAATTLLVGTGLYATNTFNTPDEATAGESEVIKLSQADAEAQLNAAGIPWQSSGNCSDRTNPACTSFEQINQSTIDGIIALRDASTCGDLMITAGTEEGHAGGDYSHWEGYKLDINPTGCVDGYITSNFEQIDDREDGYAQWQSAAGNIYCDESDHWDIYYVAT